MSDVWKDRERHAAKVLGGKRHVRATRYERAPDVDNVDGWAVEVKLRKNLPVFLAKAIAQAEARAILGSRPVAVIYQRGSRAGLAVVRLEHFAELIRRPA